LAERKKFLRDGDDFMSEEPFLAAREIGRFAYYELSERNLFSFEKTWNFVLLRFAKPKFFQKP
jgi:hypothetical protein